MIEVNLAAVRQVLVAKRRELEASSFQREEILIEVSADELDRRQQIVNREVAISNINRESNLLKEVIAAMARLSEGTYGMCLGCEEIIPEKRLRAVPWAAYCITCQEQLDRTRPKGRADMDDLAA
ncbi:MAG: TraR/DksA family transcriptional regulator [Acidobacteriaceae bacterium]|nr:TraR/DksA family transcriptional regulator [Acidobacteriaceae bacterium]